MKKTIAMLLTLAMTIGLLSGCAGVPVAIESPKNETVKEEVAEAGSLKTGLSVVSSLSVADATAEADGNATTDISIIAVTVNDSGVIESCAIDAVQGKVSFGTDGQLTSEPGEVLSKNELGENYGMKAFSPIGKEWNEQAAYIAEYAVGKTVEELKTNAIDETGVVKDADLASGATIYMGSFIWGIEAAVNNATYLGASTGDQLVLTSISNSNGSASADGEAAGKAAVTSNIVALTAKGDVITSCIIDAVQSSAEFGTDGIVGTEAGEVLSKNQLGENYGLKAYSPIGKEWNEQTAAFCEYVTGKTGAEVANIALTETTAPAEADLAASVSIAVGDFMALIEKATANLASEKNEVKTGYHFATTLSTADATADISLIAVTVTEEGVIESCAIDAIQGKVAFDAKGQLTTETGVVLSKNELGENYGMKAASPIGKEWNEQAAYIAEYAVGKTVEELKTTAIDEAGMVKDADLASGATIYMGSFIWGIEAAVNNAQYLGAESGDKLVITSTATSIGSKTADDEEEGVAQVDANVAIMTANKGVITSCIFDAVQAKASFGTDGAFTTEAGEVLSKNQLGENYGLKAYSPIGKEWNEQVAAFAQYVTGKTAEEVAGIALTETTAPAEADLASSVTIAMGDFMALIEKAAADLVAENEEVKTGYYFATTLSKEDATAEADGTVTADISLIAVTVTEEGVIESCAIDAIQGKVAFDAKGQLTTEAGEVLSKNELGENYGMKAFSPIGKEWNEQAAYIAEYVVGKTVEELKTTAIDEAGMVKDADLASGATIYMGSFIWGIEAAVNNASYLGAQSGDKLVITSKTSSAASKSAGEEEGAAQVDSNVAIMTKNGEVITSCIFDAVQAKASFGADGVVTTEAGAVSSKNQLGENYGLKAYSPIGKEWNEQVAAFAQYVTGKTAKEVAGIALSETTAPAEADLASSVTIAIGDLMALVEKSAK